MAQLNPEPSMEDILASIKRIIAEDSEAAATRAPRVKRGPVAVPDPVPEHAADSEPVEPVGDIVAELPAEEPAEPTPVVGEPSDVLELTSPLIDPEPETMTPAAATSFPTSSGDPIDGAEPASGETILSGAAALASRNAFAALTQLQVRSDEGKSNTLEGLVADLLRPMLRDWLDRELPSLVERLVQDEIKRVSGRG